MVGRSRLRTALLLLVLGVSAVVAPTATGQSGSEGRGAVVVQHGDVSGDQDCVEFSQADISSFDALDETRFEYLAAQYSFGRAICWLDGEGCETTDPDGCFCDPASRSWSLWVQEEGDAAPQASEVGPGDRTFKEGSIDYWVWGPFGAPPVAQTTVEDVCGAEVAQPTSDPQSPDDDDDVDGDNEDEEEETFGIDEDEDDEDEDAGAASASGSASGRGRGPVLPATR